jgi:excisionase family DNA binding protein
MAKIPLEDRKRFSTGQLAELIGASRTTIVRWIEEGRLRARRSVGGWYIITREEVMALLFDLGFSKEVPYRIRKAAEEAYPRMEAAGRNLKPETGSQRPGKPRT